MRRLLLTLRFCGGAYHGWQVQKNAVTVQQRVQDAVEAVFGVREDLTGCSRTDAGVHANMYCCCFCTASAMPCEKIICALNAFLPKDIAAYDCREVAEDFHARYSCVSKEYIYKIWNAKHRNPFSEGRYLWWKYPLNEKMLNDEAKAFIGTFDYKGFSSAGSSVEDTVRTVKSFSAERNGDEVIFRVEADGFLYNMVRIMAGTLLDISSGKIPAGELRDIILSCDRSRAGVTAPAHGLYLNRVNYDGKDAAKT